MFNLKTEDGLPIEQIPIKYLPNPYKQNIWSTNGIVTKSGVKKQIIYGRFIDKPFDPKIYWNKIQHEQRIAYLVLKKDITPISLDVGVNYFYDNFLADGHHRIAAAIYRHETNIPGVFSGNVKLIELFMRGEFS